MVALLDVSVLIPLFEPDHVNHHLAHAWFEDRRRLGWATCPLTENGLVRVTTSPSFFDPPHRAADVIQQLRQFRRSGDHQFWADAISLTDERVFDIALIRGHKQVTNIYLLGLATTKGGVFATLDQAVRLATVKGATTANLVVISAAPEESTSEDT